MKLLGGRYETLKAIASGGMATVHLGRSVGVGGFERLVAIKVMHPHIACEPEFVAMFLDEARLAARIRHPNVVATIDVQEVEEGLFLVMEFVDGPSLAALTKAVWRGRETLPLGVCVRVVLDTLAGLHEAHELADDDGEPLRLVHRDVSPANILVGGDGVVRITDFGVARAEARLSSTRGGQLKGKVPYMPPEQLLGEAVDRRCDVYAAGAVLWESLVGRRLFVADSDGALVQRIISGPPHTAREVNPTVPEALDRVCMRALSTSLAARFPTAAAFAEELEAAAAEDGISIATSRAVASFVEHSGAHTRLDPKELAALKRAPSTAEACPPGLQSSPSAKAARLVALGSVPSQATREAVAEQRAAAPSDRGGSAGPPALPAAAPLPEPPLVTATEATVSAKADPPDIRPKRKGLVLGVAAAVAATALVVGLLATRNGEDGAAGARDAPAAAASGPDPAGRGGTPAATAASADAVGVQPSSSAGPGPSGSAPASSTAASQPNESPSLSSTARASRPPKAKPSATAAGPKTPPGVSTSYNPDRL